MKNKITAAFFTCILALVYSSVSLADGSALYASKGCVACHGQEGKSVSPIWPKLNGQHKQYLASQIKDIRDGKRTNGMSATMKPMVASLTDAEIDEIADYLSKVQ